MIKYLALIVACLLLLFFGGIHALASDELREPVTATLSINGTAFEDTSRDAIFSIDEKGLSGWVIRLKLSGREVANTTTDESGMYSFIGLEPGNYTVTEDPQEGWEQSYPGSGYYDIYLSDKSAYRADFGNFRVSGEVARSSRASVEPSKTPDQYEENTIDHDGKVLKTLRITPQMIEHEWDVYEKAPSALRPKRDDQAQSTSNEYHR